MWLVALVLDTPGPFQGLHQTHRRGCRRWGRRRPRWKPPGHRCCCLLGTRTHRSRPRTSGTASGGSHGPGEQDGEGGGEGVEGPRSYWLGQASSQASLVRPTEAAHYPPGVGGRTASGLPANASGSLSMGLSLICPPQEAKVPSHC